MSDDIKINMTALDQLLKDLADDNNAQGDLFYNTTQSSATNISSIAGNTYPYVTTGNGYSFNLQPNLINSNPGLSFDDTWLMPNDPGLKVKGDADFDGDVKIKGKSIIEMFENIEKRLGILHPNEELEEKWEELKALGERYRALEKDIIEKEKIWSILKK